MTRCTLSVLRITRVWRSSTTARFNGSFVEEPRGLRCHDLTPSRLEHDLSKARGRHERWSSSLGGSSDELGASSTIVHERWIQQKNDLLSTKQLGDNHVDDALDLLQAMNQHASLARDPDRIADLFAVLDRFSEEHWLQVNSDRNNLLHGVMLAWRELIESVTLKNEHNGSDQEHRELREGDKGLGPFTVLEKVLDYCESGLFEQSALPLDVILNAMNTVYNSQAAPYQGHKLLQQVLERRSQAPLQKAYLDESTVHEAINLWTKSGLPEATERAESYLDQLKQWHEQSGLETHRPSARTYCSMMEAYSRDSNVDYAINRIDELFDEMKTSSKYINAVSYSRACHAFADIDHPESADRASSVLDEMFHLYEQYNDETMKPTPYVYSAVIHAYGRVGQVERAAALFEYMDSLAEKRGDSGLRPNKFSYKALIWAHARAGNARAAESLLPQMMTSLDGEEFDSELIGDIAAAIQVAWSRAGDEHAAENVAMIIQRLQTYIGEEKLPLQSYNVLLSCYAKQQNAALGAKVADDLLGWLEHQGDGKIKPDASSYLNVMLAWKNAGSPERCEGALRHLLKKVKEGAIEEGSVGPSHFNVPIGAWANAPDRPKAANKALYLIRRMKKYDVLPDSVSYNSVILALARSRNPNIDSFEEAVRLFSEMIEQWKMGDVQARPDDITFNSILVACAHSRSEDAIPTMESLMEQMELLGIRLNRSMYNSIMTAWAKRKQPERVEEVFQEMQRAFENGDAACKPHRHSYVTRLRGWVSVGNVEKAILVLDEMTADLRLDLSIRDVNAVLEAFLYSKHDKAAEMADWCLHFMFRHLLGDFPGELLAEQDVEALRPGVENSRLRLPEATLPDVFSFTLVISNYTRSASPAASYRAYYLLDKLKSLAAQFGERSLQPTVRTYFEVIDVLRHSGDRRVGKLILSLLHEMETKGDDFWKSRSTEADPRLRSTVNTAHRKLSQSDLDHKREIMKILSSFRSRSKAWRGR